MLLRIERDWHSPLSIAFFNDLTTFNREWSDGSFKATSAAMTAGHYAFVFVI